MGSVRVALRLRFIKLPGVVGERVFKDAMLIRDPEERSYQDLSDIVERKLSFMEIPPSDFTVFHEDEHGDRVVVDDAYFDGLLHKWTAAKDTAALAWRDVPGTAELDEGEGPGAEVAVALEVEVNRLRGVPAPDPGLGSWEGSALSEVHKAVRPPAPPPPSAPLTSENLARLRRTLTEGGAARSAPVTAPSTASTPVMAAAATPAEVHVPIGALTCPPSNPHFFIRGVITAIRVKDPKPGVTVAELDIADVEKPSQQITSVTFDPAVQKAIRETLRSDPRQVVELHHVYVRRKSDADARYQTNSHPLLLRMDRHSKVTVVQWLANPVVVTTAASAAPVEPIVTVCDPLRSGGTAELGALASRSRGALTPSDLMRTTPHYSTAYPPTPTGYPPLGLMSSSSSSLSGGGGPRRTTFSFGSGSSGASPTPISGAVPSALGQRTRAQQEAFMQRRAQEAGLPFEPGVIPVTEKDVRMRERLVEHHANTEASRKERIRRRREVSSSCLLCGLNCAEGAACMAQVEAMLQRSSHNKGRHIPSLDELREALSDHRRVPHGGRPTRLVCQAHFVNLLTKSVHVVHCRCVHLCTGYQSGKDLEDMALCDLPTQMCTLCGQPGATVSCYHPDCSEMYHTVCALFSNGYVNFGQRDPYLPCPACPRHTQVVVSEKPKGVERVLHVDSSCWQDGIAFDSRVVESSDLRDPDENDGE